MMDLYIDETNLYNRMFLYTKQFDWEKMWAIADDITDEDAIRAKAQDILDTFDIEGGGTIEKVWDMAKYVVAFERMGKRRTSWNGRIPLRRICTGQSRSSGQYADPGIFHADQTGYSMCRRG